MREDKARKWTAKRAAKKSGSAGPQGPHISERQDHPSRPLTAEDKRLGYSWPAPKGSAGVRGPRPVKPKWDGPHRPLTAEDIRRGFSWPAPTGTAGTMGPRSPHIDRMANLESVRREAARRQAPDGMFLPRGQDRWDDLTSGWIYGADPVRPGLLGQPYADSERMNAWVNRKPRGDISDERWSSPEDFTWRIAEARRRYAAEQQYLQMPQPRPINNNDYWSSDDGY